MYDAPDAFCILKEALSLNASPESVPINTRSELSIVIAVASALSSIPFEVNVVNVPAAAVDPPIVVPSMFPPFISAVGIVTVPVKVGEATAALASN